MKAGSGHSRPCPPIIRRDIGAGWTDGNKCAIESGNVGNGRSVPRQTADRNPASAPAVGDGGVVDRLTLFLEIAAHNDAVE